MPRYQCRVMTDSGKIVDEVFTADSKKDLMLSMESHGYRPIEIVEERVNLMNMQLGGKKLKEKSLILFCRQMATLLRSGVPLIKCFDIIASQTDDKVFHKALDAISMDVQAGSVLSSAVAARGELFPPMLSKMIEIGEATGDLAKIMERMADQYESDSKTKKKVKGAMIYPIALMCIAIGASIFMLIAIVPRFVDMFDSLGADLPGLTKALLTLSTFITKKWYILVLVVPIIVILIIRLFRTDKVATWVDGTLLTVRPIAQPAQKLVCARLARTLYTLIGSGIPIVQALEYTKQSLSNRVVQKALTEVSEGVQKGRGLSVQMETYPFFPKLMISMLSIGEASGNLEEMLEKTAEYYDDELGSAISQLTTIIEPVMILFVGVLIGGIVMALYAPMFGIISSMSATI